MTEPATYYEIEPVAYTGRASRFTYSGPQDLAPGQVVLIPLGNKKRLGVIREAVPKPDFESKPIAEVLDLPPLPGYLIKLADWISTYYAASPSSVWTAMLPAGLTKKRRIVSPKEPKPGAGLPPLTLTPEQQAALESIRSSDKPATLLQGVTGSGKTRVYQELAADTLAAGRSVIILVPEITLTPQVIGQFEHIFGPVVLATHSKLTEAARDKVWRQAITAQAAGQPRVVIGPRSSLFLPLHDPGLIVVDECHETTYKQDQHPRYDAIVTAGKLASIVGAKAIFGSATPGLREVQLAANNRINLVRLTKRANEQSQPQAIILDLRDKSLFKLNKFITQPLIDALAITLAAGRQSLLYINRRGSASAQLCEDCGYVSKCPDCRLPLTFHGDTLRLICHHCNYKQPSGAACPDCGGILKFVGGGTKRIEAELKLLFPNARIARLDRDSATMDHLESVYAGLHDGTIDILIGTQMIAKGLDFPRLDTVGIISADTMLYLPDFGAAERTFGLLTQVSGRAGRGDAPGTVYIQTYTPDHPAITSAAAADFWGFTERELAIRRDLNYPPYTYLLKLTFSEPTDAAAQARAAHVMTQLKGVKGLDVAGPAPAFMAYSAQKYHWQVTVKAKNRAPLVDIANQLPDTVTADLDAVSLL